MSNNVNIFEKIIPAYVPNSIVLTFFSLIALLTGPVKKGLREYHYEENLRLLSGEGKSLFKNQGLIENQKEWENVLFGSHKKSNVQYSGCAIIATYNALRSLGDNSIGMPYLIRYYEQKGIALKGGFGITPKAPYGFFKKKGYDVKKVTTRKEAIIDRLGEDYHSFIVTFYWNRENIKDQLHTVCVSKETDGFYIHNNYCRLPDGTYTRQGAYRSLSDAVGRLGKYTAPLVVIGIRK